MVDRLAWPSAFWTGTGLPRLRIEIRGKAVPQRVQVDVLGDPRLGRGALHYLLDVTRQDWLSF